jgi:transposase-like protein
LSCPEKGLHKIVNHKIMKRIKNHTDKSRIIAEYLNSYISFKALGEKFNIPERTIQSWVRAHRLKQGNKDVNIRRDSDTHAGERDADLKQELQKLRLKNELLEEMLRLSEQATGINLRKKFGTRQS